MKTVENQVAIAVLMPHAPTLVPAVGGTRGNRASASVNAMAEVARRVVRTHPDALVLISPHTPRRAGAFAIWAGQKIHGSLDQFGAPEAAVNLPADTALAETIVREADKRGVTTWWLRHDTLDHGATVPLWHLTDAGWEGPTVVIGLNYPGEPGLRELGEAIAAAAKHTGQRVAVIASGDMSHCLQPGAPAGYHPRAKDFDQTFIEHVRGGDYLKLLELDPALQNLAAEDAVYSTVIAAAAADWNSAGHEVLSYEGPFGVGYGIAVLYEAGAAKASHHSQTPVNQANNVPEAGKRLVQIARQAVEAAFSGTAKPDFPTDGITEEQRAVFVTIRSPGRKLRGCVGTMTPHFANVAEETWHVARDAAFRDGRFTPVSPEELDGLHFEVSVLSPLEEISSPAELDTQRYGVLVSTNDGRRGVLLPAIEGIETVAQQVAYARRKGGIGESEPVRLQRFEVRKFCECT